MPASQLPPINLDRKPTKVSSTLDYVPLTVPPGRAESGTRRGSRSNPSQAEYGKSRPGGHRTGELSALKVSWARPTAKARRIAVAMLAAIKVLLSTSRIVLAPRLREMETRHRPKSGQQILCIVTFSFFVQDTFTSLITLRYCMHSVEFVVRVSG